MKEVAPQELVSAVPLPMTRKEKLLRWAELIRKTDGYLRLHHRLEHTSAEQRAVYWIYGPTAQPTGFHNHCAFAVAAADPVFQAQGLKGHVAAGLEQHGPMVSVGDVMNFMDLSLEDAHAFSCDCGGQITNADMATRIGAIAEGVFVHPHPVAQAFQSVGSFIVSARSALNHRP
jgi:hypothetical protein